jgi:hypothetical protein
MRVATAFLAFVILVSASALQARTPSDTRLPRKKVTIDFLYEACADVGDPASERGEIPFFDCESFVYGVLDAYLIARSGIPQERRACFPDSLPPWKALEDVHEIIGQTQGSRLAAPVIIESLRKKYPCTSK